jgi:lipid-A-disaccharide synthase
LTVSGTVTLEAAILETPMIVLYNVSRLSGQIGKLLIRTKFVGLPNLIAGRAIAPEFVWEEPTGPRLAECAIKLLLNPALLDEQRLELKSIRNQLGAPGVSARVARLVLDTARGVL